VFPACGSDLCVVRRVQHINQGDGHSNRARMVFASSPVRLIGSILNLI
jgi:hypothetical protein